MNELSRSFQLVNYEGSHLGRINSICNDDKYLYSASDDCTIRVWDKNSRVTIAILWAHDRPIWDLKVDSNCIYSASLDNTIKVWDKASLLIKYQLLDHQGPIEELFICETNIYSASHDGTIKIWNKNNYQLDSQIEQKDLEFRALFCTKDKIYAATNIPSIIVYDKKGISKILEKKLDCKVIFKIYVDESRIYIASTIGILILDKKDLNFITKLEAHTSPVVDLLVEGDCFYSCSTDYSVIKWNKHNYHLIEKYKHQFDSILSISLDKRSLYAGTDTYAIIEWDITNKKNPSLFGKKLGPLGAFNFKAHADDKYFYFSECDKDGSVVRIINRSTLKSITYHRIEYWVQEIISDNKFIYIKHNSTCFILEKNNLKFIKELRADDVSVNDKIEQASLIKRQPIMTVGTSRNVIADFTPRELLKLRDEKKLYHLGYVLSDQTTLGYVIIPNNSSIDILKSKASDDLLKRIKNSLIENN